MKPRPWIIHIAALLVAAGVPFLARWARRSGGGRCALDGVRIDPVYRVQVRAENADRSFCCIWCGETWLARTAAADQRRRKPEVTVTGEDTGEPLDADHALYVRSLVVTTPTTNNRIHAFSSRAAALRHAESAGGELLTGASRPFH